MSAIPISSINHRHEQIINWLIANPHLSLGECARTFNYTQNWLSQVIHSDMFQAIYRRRVEEEGGLVVHTMANKLTGLAAAVVDKTLERIEMGLASERFLSDTTETVLGALGYSAKALPQQAQQHLHVHLTPEDLVQAREARASQVEGQSRRVLPGVFPGGDPALDSLDVGEEVVLQ